MLYLNECNYKHPFVIEDIYVPNLYPSTSSEVHNKLKKKISSYCSVDTDNITITAGGDDAIQLCVDNIFGKLPQISPKCIYKYDPSYNFISELEYKTFSVETPLRDKYKSMKMYNPPPNSIIYVCNPCNPTGELWCRDDYLQLCEDYPLCHVVVDEAYIDFHKICSSCHEVNIYNNLYYIRTFSKLFGLAGMRIGYLVHPKSFISNYSYKKVLTVSKLYALKVFDNLAFYNTIKEKVKDNIKRLGLVSHGNFILIRPRHDQFNEIKSELEHKGIIARYVYGNTVRLTINPDIEFDYISYIVKKYNKLPDIRTFFTDIDFRINLVKMLRCILDVFDKKYTWWADAGTRLGCERQGTIIPWDDDVDIGIIDSDFKNDYSEFENYVSKYFNLKRNRTGDYYQICDITFEGHPNQTAYVDIFPYIMINGRFYNNDERFREHVDGEVNMSYSYDELFPLRYAEIYDFQIPVPACKLHEQFNNLEIRDGQNNMVYFNTKVFMA